MNAPKIVKKVQPYPIDASIDINGLKKNIDIVRLSPMGFIARLKPSVLFVVGQRCGCMFALPVTRESINTSVRVIKTYDRMVEPKQMVVERMAEFHFEGLGSEYKNRLVAFLQAIGQIRS